MDRIAVAYLANGKLIVAPVIRTTTGLELDVEPRSLPIPLTAEVVANALENALANSARVVPHPAQDEWRDFFKPFQDAAGLRSRKAFMADAKRVSIREFDGKLELTPHQNLGARDGFEPLPDAAKLLPRQDMLGAATALTSLLGLNDR